MRLWRQQERGRLDLGYSWGSWSPLGTASMGAGWCSCYLGQGIEACSLSYGSLGSQEFWKLRHELQKHLASQMGWTLVNSAQAMSLQTLEGPWETQADARLYCWLALPRLGFAYCFYSRKGRRDG